MSAPIRVEVRCCCRPMSLLGWLQLPPFSRLRVGQHWRFAMRAADRMAAPVALSRSTDEQITLELARYVVRFPAEGDEYSGVAFRSDHTPIEVLRRVVGFIEHRGGPDGQTQQGCIDREERQGEDHEGGEAREGRPFGTLEQEVEADFERALVRIVEGREARDA